MVFVVEICPPIYIISQCEVYHSDFSVHMVKSTKISFHKNYRSKLFLKFIKI